MQLHGGSVRQVKAVNYTVRLTQAPEAKSCESTLIFSTHCGVLTFTDIVITNTSVPLKLNWLNCLEFQGQKGPLWFYATLKITS